jgi:uncharacterized membrane protein HdeD (DUF308 family)
VRPGITLLALTILWGAYAISDPVFAFAAAIAGKGFETSARWWLAQVGLCGIFAGILTFVVPGMTEFVLLMYIASWRDRRRRAAGLGLEWKRGRERTR